MTQPKTFTFVNNGWTAKGVLSEDADGSGSYSLVLFDDEPPYPDDNHLAIGDMTWERYRINGAAFDVSVIDRGNAFHGHVEDCKRAGPKAYAHVVHHLNRSCIADHEGFYTVRGTTAIRRSCDGAFICNVYDEGVEFISAAAKRQDLKNDD